jgi:hypothetical protein
MEEKAKLVAGPRWWSDTRRDWPTDRRSQENFDFNLRQNSVATAAGSAAMSRTGLPITVGDISG